METARSLKCFKMELSAWVWVWYPVFRLRRYYCGKSKPILCLDTVYCKFLLYVSVEIDPFSCEKIGILVLKLTFNI